eukprot:6188452-Pleurochrysis_carterae.AAC.1
MSVLINATQIGGDEGWEKANEHARERQGAEAIGAIEQRTASLCQGIAILCTPRASCAIGVLNR